MTAVEIVTEKVRELVAPLGAEERLQIMRSIAPGVAPRNAKRETVRARANERRQRQQKESDAWFAMSLADRQLYSGNFVAVWEGQVVDSDPDQSEIYLRVRAQFGSQPVLIIHADWEETPEFTIHSRNLDR